MKRRNPGGSSAPPAVSRATSTRPGRGSRATASGVRADTVPLTMKKPAYAHRPIARVPASSTKPAGRRRAVERAMVRAPIRGPTRRRSASGSTTAVQRVMFELDRTPVVWPIATVTEMSAIPRDRSTAPVATPATIAAMMKPRISERARANVSLRKSPLSRRSICGANACSAAPPTGAAPTRTTRAGGAPSNSKSGTKSASEAYDEVNDWPTAIAWKGR